MAIKFEKNTGILIETLLARAQDQHRQTIAAGNRNAELLVLSITQQSEFLRQDKFKHNIINFQFNPPAYANEPKGFNNPLPPSPLYVGVYTFLTVDVPYCQSLMAFTSGQAIILTAALDWHFVDSQCLLGLVSSGCVCGQLSISLSLSCPWVMSCGTQVTGLLSAAWAPSHPPSPTAHHLPPHTEGSL